MRFHILIIFSLLLLSSCANVTEEITLNPSGSGTFACHTDLSQAMAMMKQKSAPAPAGMPSFNFNRDIDYSSTLLLLPDSFSLHAVVKPASSIATLDTRIFVNDLSELQKMHDQWMRQIGGLGNMMGMMAPKGADSAKRHMDWMRGMRILETTWSAHEIKRTFNQALYDSLKASGMGKLDSARQGGSGPNGASLLPMAMAMMGNGSFKMIFHLPSPAQHVEGDPYTLSDDRKTVVLERKFIDIFKDPKTLAFTIDY